MSVNDVFTYSVTGSGTANFNLSGGAYGVAVAASSWGTVALEVMAADGSTYVPYATWSANTAADFNLTAGSYQFVYDSVDTATLSIAQQPNPGWRPNASLPLPISVSGAATVYADMPNTTEVDVVGGSSGAWLFSSDASGDDNSGSAGVGSGSAANGASGVAWLYSGNVSGSGTSGEVHIQTGDSSAGDTGSVFISTGSADGTRGTLQLDTNQVVGTNGLVVVTPDNGSGDSQPMLFQTGTATGTRGSITLDGHVVIIANLPTSASGLPSGALWNSSGTVKVA